MKQKTFLSGIALCCGLALTACGGNKSKDLDAAEVQRITDSIVNAYETAHADSMARVDSTAHADSIAKEEARKASPEYQVIGRWEAPGCDADMMWDDVIYEFADNGRGTKTISHMSYDLDKGKSVCHGKDRESFSWSLEGDHVFFDGTECKLKGKRMYIVEGGVAAYDDPCSTFKKIR